MGMQEPTSATVAHMQDVKSNGDTGLTFNTLMDRAKAAPQDQHMYMDSGEVGHCHQAGPHAVLHSQPSWPPDLPTFGRLCCTAELMVGRCWTSCMPAAPRLGGRMLCFQA